jgi:hypothetical protein
VASLRSVSATQNFDYSRNLLLLRHPLQGLFYTEKENVYAFLFIAACTEVNGQIALVHPILQPHVESPKISKGYK